MNLNTVFLIMTAMAANFYWYIVALSLMAVHFIYVMSSVSETKVGQNRYKQGQKLTLEKTTADFR